MRKCFELIKEKPLTIVIVQNAIHKIDEITFARRCDLKWFYLSACEILCRVFLMAYAKKHRNLNK